MAILEILYYIALVLFILMTFLIIRNYYRSKFDEEGNRIEHPGGKKEER